MPSNKDSFGTFFLSLTEKVKIRFAGIPTFHCRGEKKNVLMIETTFDRIESEKSQTTHGVHGVTCGSKSRTHSGKTNSREFPSREKKTF